MCQYMSVYELVHWLQSNMIMAVICYMRIIMHQISAKKCDVGIALLSCTL